MSYRSSRSFQLGALAAIALAGATGARGQIALHAIGPNRIVHIQNTDLAVLEARDPRKDLPCVVANDKAFLGFDLRFHAGYDITVPLRELAGNENLLTVLFRVTSETERDNPRYFVQRIQVPHIDEDAKGEAALQGAFDLGEGKYHVDLLMRDRSERVCSFYWDVEAALPPKDKQMGLMIQPSAIEPMRREQFHEEPPVERSAGEPLLSVKVMVNFAPQKATASSLRPLDTAALVSILRTLSREPRIGKFSVVAFNLHEQKVIYRQDNADRIDFKSLGESLNKLNPGTVQLGHLAVKHSETQFLAELMGREMAGSKRPDALIFAGPKALLDANVPEEQLKSLGGEIDYPLFYLNYVLNPHATPWRDTIGNAVKFFKGTEFTISRPRELWFAVSDMVSRIVKFRNGKHVAAVSGK